MPDDPYETLGLEKTATADDIKKAYRKLVRTSHPDLHPDDEGAEARFKAISAAYDILKDPETRARFDAGEIDGLGAGATAAPVLPRLRRCGGQRLSAGARLRSGRRSGGHLRGDPAQSRTLVRRRFRRGRVFGRRPAMRATRWRCRFWTRCAGAETRITLPDGQALAVKIPRGTEDGQTLRLRGKGAPGFGGGPAGDALITIFVRPHPVFRRDGDDIVLTLPITIDEAILGAKVTAPTIDGPVSLTVPPGASSGRVLRLRGRGVGHAGSKTNGRSEGRVEDRRTHPT
jgi:DnaJ-class molecular chaperone